MKAVFLLIVFLLMGGIVVISLKNSTDGELRNGVSGVHGAMLDPVKEITHGHGLVVDGTDPQTLYIATHHGLLVLKNDTDLYRVGEMHDDVMGFLVHPAKPGVLYRSGHPQKGGNLGFQKSEDGGLTWQKVSDGFNGPVDFHAIAQSPANPNLLYGWYQGAIQRSEDGGRSWEVIVKEVLVNQLLAHPKDENLVYATTAAGTLISKDKGVTWQPLSNDLEGGEVSALAIDPQDPASIVVFSEKMGGLVKSMNGGETWQKIRENFGGEIVLYIAWGQAKSNILYALTHENRIYKSEDKGKTWSKIR